MQLRYLQTLADMSTSKAYTIVFPLPMDIMEAFRKKAGESAGSSQDGPKPENSPGAAL